MYADYLKERLGKKLVQKTTGFYIYSVNGEDLYLEEIYVAPEFRKAGEAQRFSEECYDLAKRLGCKFLIGSVNLDAAGAEYSARIILENGFKFYFTADRDRMIYFRKEVK